VDSLTAADPRTVGEFRLLARLGSGGMGQVFLATSPAGRMVAVKIIHPELARDPKFVSRFRSEVSAARLVSGLYTAPVVAAGVDASPLWLATAFVAGPSLDDIVTRRGRLPVPAVWRLAAGLAEALRAIHSAGLVHRDLKPENVLLALDGPRVIDFGISRALKDTRLTGNGMVMGTPAYMAPEHVEGQATGPHSDVFSLGCVLAFAASGTTPFSSPGAATASVFYRVVHAEPDLAGVPAEVRGLIAACLAKDPALRPDLGKVASLGTAETAHLGLSPAAFWPPGVAQAIAAQQEAVTAHVWALQVTSSQGLSSVLHNKADTASLVARAAGQGSRAEAVLVPPAAPGLTAGASPGTASAAADAPASDSPDGTGEPAASHGAPADNGSARDGSTRDGSTRDGSTRDGSARDGSARDGSADGQAQAPAIAGSPTAASGNAAAGAGAGAGSVSRRGLLIGAGVAGVAVLGGLAGWALAPGSSPRTGGTAKGSGAGRVPASGRASPSHRTKADQPGRDGAPGASGAAGEQAQPALPDIAGLAPGQKVWAFATGGWVNANPIVVDGVVYVGSRDGHLYAVNAATGLLAWRYPALGLFAAPTFTAGIVGTASTGGNFYANNGHTGMLAWEQTTVAAREFMRGWATDGGDVIMPTTAGALKVYDAQTGTTITTYTTSAGFSGTIAAEGDIIYALDGDGTLHAISENGVAVWSTPLLQNTTAGTGLVVAGDTIYLGATAGKLYSLDVGTGDVNWSYQAQHNLGSDPVIAYGNVYFSDIRGVVYAITAAQAAPVWTYSTAIGAGSIGPAVANGQVYLCTSDSVQSLAAASGEPGWSFTAPGGASFMSTPAVADGIVYVGCQDNNVYAILG
jgi:outer membrane protein assembly factor BamB